MRLNAVSNGFTLLEMVLTAALVAALSLAGALALRANRGLWKQASSRHVLEVEIGDVADLLGGLLRRADPSTIVIDSSPEAPWSRLRLAAGRHRYAFYGEGDILFFRVDDLQPKALSSHLVAMQFATARSRLPTLLTWYLCLGLPGVHTPGSRVSFSASQFLEQVAE